MAIARDAAGDVLGWLIGRGEGRRAPTHHPPSTMTTDLHTLDIKTGLKSGDYVEVLDGLKAGDEIVVSGQFLLDSESNLQASFRRLGAE